MKKEKRTSHCGERTFDYGTHPGAYTTDYDIDNQLLDTVDSADDVYPEKMSKAVKPANHASPPAADPPVPNRAHTQI